MPFRWTIYDPVEDATMTFPINPREGALPQRERNLSTVPVTAPDGPPLIFEGEELVQEFPFSGTILTQAHWQFMTDWFEKRRQVRIVDDNGMTWWLYLKSFKPKRKNRHSHPWAADYDAVAIVLDWAAPEVPGP